MLLSWMEKMRNMLSVEKDYRFYDPPLIIWYARIRERMENE